MCVLLYDYGKDRDINMSFFDLFLRHMFHINEEIHDDDKDSENKNVSYYSDIEKCLWEIKDDLNLTTEEIEIAMKDSGRDDSLKEKK